MPPGCPRLLRLLVALFALASQVAVDASTPRPAPEEALAAAAIFCQPHHVPGTKHRPAPVTTPALCPVGVAAAQPAPLPVFAPVLPVPTASPAFRGGRGGFARAGPSAPLTAAYPRGPPHLT